MIGKERKKENVLGGSENRKRVKVKKRYIKRKKKREREWEKNFKREKKHLKKSKSQLQWEDEGRFFFSLERNSLCLKNFPIKQATKKEEEENYE